MTDQLHRIAGRLSANVSIHSQKALEEHARSLSECILTDACTIRQLWWKNEHFQANKLQKQYHLIIELRKSCRLRIARRV